MAKYRTKSTEIEAIQLTREKIFEVIAFTGARAENFSYENDHVCCDVINIESPTIKVQEGKYIVKNSNGDFYLCSEDSFESLYEKV